MFFFSICRTIDDPPRRRRRGTRLMINRLSSPRGLDLQLVSWRRFAGHTADH
jgi:hypothetical protein